MVSCCWYVIECCDWQVTEDITLVARKMSAPVMTIHDEETTDPFADVDDAFPQEGWRRQKEDKEDGLIKQVFMIASFSCDNILYFNYIIYRRLRHWITLMARNLKILCSRCTMFYCFRKKSSTNVFSWSVIVFLLFLMPWAMTTQPCDLQHLNCAWDCLCVFKEVLRITSVTTSCICSRFNFIMHRLFFVFTATI